MKKKQIVLATLFAIGIIGWLLPGASALDAETTLEYLDYTPVTLQGNVTLSFVLSETGTNDFDVTFSTYIYDGSNITGTIYIISSDEITYDWHFINNTKCYIFKDQNDKLYRFDIDYTSIEIPLDPELVDTKDNLTLKLGEIDELETEIDGLYINIDELDENLTSIDELYVVVCNELENLNDSYVQLDHNYRAQQDVNVLILNQSMISSSNYGIQLRENEYLTDNMNELNNKLNSPVGYALYGVTFFLGFVAFWQYRNYKEGKGFFGKQKGIETHRIQHQDSSEINRNIKNKIQDIKPKIEADVPKATPYETITNDIDSFLSKVDKENIEVA